METPSIDEYLLPAEDTIGLLIQKIALLSEFSKTTELNNDICCVIKISLCNSSFQLVCYNDIDTLTNLFSYINKNTSFSHVLYRDLPYYEWENTRSHNVPEVRPDYDPDNECDDSDYEYDFDNMDETAHGHQYNVIPDLDDVKYVISYPMYKPTLITMYDDILTKHDPRNILITNNRYNSTKEFTFLNEKGVYNDHRGCNHCKIFLDIYADQKITLPITLHDLTVVFYRSKGNKWDKEYEMYCGLTYKSRWGNLIGGNLIIEFDHGS